MSLKDQIDDVDTFDLPIQLRLADTDELGHINNAAFIKFLETARTEWQIAIKGSRSAVSDWDWILGRISIRFAKQARLADTLTVKMWCSRIGSKSWDFGYMMVNQNGEEVAQAQTTQIAYDDETRNSKLIPKTIRADLESRVGPVVKT